MAPKKAAKSPRKKSPVAKALRKRATKAPAKKKTAAARKSAAAGARPDKGEGKGAVHAYLAALPDWQRKIAKRIDALVTREVGDARRAVKWGAAFYGVAGQGWFVSVKGFSKHVKVTFFRGTSLKPVPPAGEHAEGRALDVREDDALDEAQVADWIRQAAKLPGWGTS